MLGTQADMPQIANPSVAALYEDALVYETGSAITSTGALTAYSGAKTGRSPLDKRVVKEEGSEKDVWWGSVNKPMSPQVSTISSRHPSTETFRQTSLRLQASAHWDPDAVLCTSANTPHSPFQPHLSYRMSRVALSPLSNKFILGLENQPRTRCRLPKHPKPNLCYRWLCWLG